MDFYVYRYLSVIFHFRATKVPSIISFTDTTMQVAETWNAFLGDTISGVWNVACDKCYVINVYYVINMNRR
jgi:hypothetical protein